MGQTDKVKELLDNGANVNEWNGGTALFTASYYGHLDVVKLLIERGAEVNTMSQRGESALGNAAAGGHMDVVNILIDNGANIAEALNGLERLATITTAPDWRAQYQMGTKQLERIAKKRAIASHPAKPVLRPSQEVSSAIISDVDELPAITNKPNKNAYAIVIGIEQYRQKLPKADYATHDAKVISEYLTKTMGYPEENVITLLGDRALKSDMEKYFDRWLNNNVEENGRVFIYYSGHGAPNVKNGDAYLVPYDGDPAFIAETGYSLARLYASLGKLKAKEIIVVLDSCFSGGGGRSVLAKGAKPLVMTINMPAIQKNISVMTASSGDQISSAYEEKGHGLFTYFMLKGIKNEDVVRPDGSIKMDDLFGYIKPHVERIARKQFNNEQTPQLIGAKK